jgi:hypothetical protein
MKTDQLSGFEERMAVAEAEFEREAKKLKKIALTLLTAQIILTLCILGLATWVIILIMKLFGIL